MAWLMLADVGASGPLGPMTGVASPSGVPMPAADPGFSWSLLGPLSLILLLLLATVLLLRFVRTRQAGLRGGMLSVVAQTPLSPTHSLYVVQAAGRYLLLGGAPGSLALLTELPAQRLAGNATGLSTEDGEPEEDEAEILDDSPPMPPGGPDVMSPRAPTPRVSR